ncbi:DUF6090 family protein [Formosa maritima]|uniref:Uncharacterized protein n=1 Tax=Formosa maritima TaxID=2592046 RepID=A0A5D0GEX6_9FLAO|nr:DUF6090 family protein [Formosa maritima]TYA57504.1 hypothetical protein FVF61_04560 [Formosa maritima]
MIKFFRHIRKNLLMENKTSKYFKYAIGEIILVVIGILIALQINNWNEKRLNENKIVSILKEVQNDLKEDILKSKELFSYYETRDSIIQLALNNKLTRENYLGDKKWMYFNVATNAFHLKIHSNGYKNFSDNLDNVPKKYQEIIAPLNEIYTYNKYEIDKFDTRIDKITDRLMDHLGATKPWYYAMRQEEISDEAVHYFLNDSLYKNALYLYSNAAGNLTRNVTDFDQNAIKAYHKIAKLTEHPKELPDFIPQHLIEPTPQQVQELLGNYTLVKVTIETGEIIELNAPFVMKVEEQTLKLISLDRNRTHDLYFKNNTSLYGVNKEASILKDENNRIIGLKLVVLNAELELIKNKD